MISCTNAASLLLLETLRNHAIQLGRNKGARPFPQNGTGGSRLGRVRKKRLVELFQGVFRQLEPPRKTIADGGKGRLDQFIRCTIEHHNRYIGEKMRMPSRDPMPWLYTPMPSICILVPDTVPLYFVMTR